MKILHRVSITAAIALLAFLNPSTRAANQPITVTSFSTILTELAKEVGGDHVKVVGLVKPGVDPHEFEPKPDDLKEVSESQVVLASGKHMENYAPKLKESAGGKADLVQVGDAFPSLKLAADEDEKKDGKPVMIDDPHWWHSIANMKRATKVVRDALGKVDPADEAAFAKNADSYLANLDALDKWARTKIAELPRDQRKLVTSHDAFQYFARDYGFTIYPIEGVSTEDEISTKKLAELIGTIKAQHVKAVFFENIENPKVIEEITKETTAKVGGELYADGLGLGDAGTYEGMFKHNVNTIVNALK